MMSQERRKRRIQRNRRRKTAVFLVIAAVAIGGVIAFGNWVGDSNQGGANTAGGSGGAENPLAGKTVELSIGCVGDVMVHRSQIASQYDSTKGTYDYRNKFEYVKPYIESLDLALVNVETTFSGGKPTSYPSFNSPDALAAALADSGLDVGITSNNHMVDKGTAGLDRTLRILRQEGLVTCGSRLSWERNYAMMKVKDLWVAVIPYTYETPSQGGKTTINSAPISDDTAARINSFNYESLDADLAKVKETIGDAREAGAHMVVCYYHWGEEYQRSPNEWQQYIAQQTADMGADMIFASHTHVLQGMETLKARESGKEVPVFYSMGNFISNQRAETLDNRYTEQGMIARVKLTYDGDSGQVTVNGADAMPTWVEKFSKGGKDVYSIIPLDGNLPQNPLLSSSGHLSRAKQALEDVNRLLGEESIWQD